MLDRKKLGLWFQNLRKRCGVTQDMIAEQLGYSISNISQFENGRVDNMMCPLFYLANFAQEEDFVQLQQYIVACFEKGVKPSDDKKTTITCAI